MEKRIQYKSEIFIESVGMLIVEWHENGSGFTVDNIEGYGGLSRNCLFDIPGFDVLLASALVRKTQQIKSARNVKNLSAMSD
jgi:hypothetical protein